MARSLNFTRAASDCNVSQPALTRAIQKLEEELGGQLFRRERSRTHLTDLGRLMLPHLERTHEAAQAAKSLARGVGKAEVAPLALGIADSIESPALSAVLADLASGLPGFDLTVTGGSSEDLLEQGLAGSLDLFIVEAPTDAPSRFEAWPLFAQHFEMLARADHPCAPAGAAALASLSDEIWIETACRGPAILRAHAAAAGFDAQFRHRAESHEQLRHLILAGLGSAFVPQLRDRGHLAAIHLIDVVGSCQIVLAAIAGRRRSLAADSFVRAARIRRWEASA